MDWRGVCRERSRDLRGRAPGSGAEPFVDAGRGGDAGGDRLPGGGEAVAERDDRGPGGGRGRPVRRLGAPGALAAGRHPAGVPRGVRRAGERAVARPWGADGRTQRPLLRAVRDPLPAPRWWGRVSAITGGMRVTTPWTTGPSPRRRSSWCPTTVPPSAGAPGSAPWRCGRSRPTWRAMDCWPGAGSTGCSTMAPPGTPWGSISATTRLSGWAIWTRPPARPCSRTAASSRPAWPCGCCESGWWTRRVCSPTARPPTHGSRSSGERSTRRSCGIPSVGARSPAGAPDRIGAATEAAARALGWSTPGWRFRRRWPGSAGVPGVAAPARPAPSWRSEPHTLRVEIDRGDVWTQSPWDASGQRRDQPVDQPPTLTLWVEHGGREEALMRWPTTIGVVTRS